MCDKLEGGGETSLRRNGYFSENKPEIKANKETNGIWWHGQITRGRMVYSIYLQIIVITTVQCGCDTRRMGKSDKSKIT